MQSPEHLQAVILTGGRSSHNPLLAGTGLHSKVLLPVAGKPMVRWVMEAIAASRYSPEIFVSTNDAAIETLETGVPFSTIPSENSAAQSLIKSSDRLPGADWVLLISGDHPLVTSEMINLFVERALAAELGFAAAVVERRTVRRDYPESRRSYFPARGGAYSGANMYMLNKAAFKPDPLFVQTIDRNRKQHWRTLPWLGYGTILLYLLGRLDIHQIAARASCWMGCRADVVVMPQAEACMDVDKPSDLAIAESILNARLAMSSFAPTQVSARTSAMQG